MIHSANEITPINPEPHYAENIGTGLWLAVIFWYLFCFPALTVWEIRGRTDISTRDRTLWSVLILFSLLIGFAIFIWCHSNQTFPFLFIAPIASSVFVWQHSKRPLLRWSAVIGLIATIAFVVSVAIFARHAATKVS